MARDLEQLLHGARAGDGATLGPAARTLPPLPDPARARPDRPAPSGKGRRPGCGAGDFLNATRNFEGFRGTTEAEFVAWLRKILAARLADLLRRYLGAKGRDIRLERDLEDGFDQSSARLDRGLVAEQPSPSQQASGREQAVLLADALSQLPEDYREVLVLRHLEGLTFPEVAERMGRSLDSVANSGCGVLPASGRSWEARHERSRRKQPKSPRKTLA